MNKVKFKQEYSYGCGLYAVSNLFGNKELLVKYLEDTKRGIFISDIENYIRFINPDYRLSDIYCDTLFLKIPKKIFVYLFDYSKEKNKSIPLLIGTIRKHKKANFHMIAGIIEPNGRMRLIDSNNFTEDNVTLDYFGVSLNTRYYCIYGIADENNELLLL